MCQLFPYLSLSPQSFSMQYVFILAPGAAAPGAAALSAPTLQERQVHNSSGHLPSTQVVSGNQGKNWTSWRTAKP